MKLSPRSPNVKKATLTAITVLLASLSFTGCGGNGGTSTTQPPTQTTPKPTGDVMDFPSGSYAHTLLLAGDNFRISWTNTDDTISIGIKAKTTGWVALALSPTLSKSQADLIIGAVVGGQVTLVDSYDPGYSGNHPVDSNARGTDDLYDIRGGETSGVTTIEFKRKLNTGDTRDITLVNGANHFLFAMGPDDTMATEHGLVGTGELTITLTHP